MNLELHAQQVLSELKGLHLLHSGVLRLYRPLLNREVTVNLVLPGEGFVMPEEVWAEALMPCVLQEVVFTPQEQAFHLQQQLLRAYELTALQQLPLKERLMQLLVRLADSPLSRATQGETRILKVNHHVLSGLSGAVREAVSRNLKELYREGFVESGYNQLVLPDVQALRERIDLGGQWN